MKSAISVLWYDIPLVISATPELSLLLPQIPRTLWVKKRARCDQILVPTHSDHRPSGMTAVMAVGHITWVGRTTFHVCFLQTAHARDEISKQ